MGLSCTNKPHQHNPIAIAVLPRISTEITERILTILARNLNNPKHAFRIATSFRFRHVQLGLVPFKDCLIPPSKANDLELLDLYKEWPTLQNRLPKSCADYHPVRRSIAPRITGSIFWSGVVEELWMAARVRSVVCSVDGLERWKKSGLELKWSHYSLDLANERGNVDVLEWWSKSGLPPNYSTRSIENASGSGHVAVLQWWKSSGLKYLGSRHEAEALATSAIRGASAGGHVQVLEWWKSSGPLMFWDETAMNNASYRGHPHVLEWWKQSGLDLKYTTAAIDQIASMDGNIKGRIEVLDWWKSSGLELRYTTLSLDIASELLLFPVHRQLEILEWWKKSGLQLKWSSKSMDNASHNGLVEVLEWWKHGGLKLKATRFSVLFVSREIREWWFDSGVYLRGKWQWLHKWIRSDPDFDE